MMLNARLMVHGSRLVGHGPWPRWVVSAPGPRERPPGPGLGPSLPRRIKGGDCKYWKRCRTDPNLDSNNMRRGWCRSQSRFKMSSSAKPLNSKLRSQFTKCQAYDARKAQFHVECSICWRSQSQSVFNYCPIVISVSFPLFK